MPAELNAQGLADDTLVIFTSDNGGVDAVANEHPQDYYTSNDPLRAGKCWPYEDGIRVPAIVRSPGHTPTRAISHEPVTGVDWMPTICEAAGVPLPGDRAIDGVSLVPLLHGRASRPRGPLYWHFPHYQHTTPYSAIRDGAWKLIRFYESSKQELYHLARDAGEAHDVASQYPAQVQSLAARLDRRLQETGARLPIPNPSYAG
ncbi:sulfatase/phosphatase domain-containing protein [Paludibaculum fermentans]|uniref:Sulfatase-like hydrolase/transferase n=1 Tax=Paludibaculum fermentans TaxID=1473598 RepID=A0A7S7SQ10_PALFE|nr:sulfatase/phosphatase domain-containing protein [Paludibaculum fermentans]QOY91735.1 sulfatase-like hydrolase/transferase [Paludibaculum fermentans]